MKIKSGILFVVLLIIVLLIIFGKKSITTEIVINAQAGQVWDELTDFNKFPDWNPFIRKVAGEIKTGNTIEVTMQLMGGKPLVFTPVILALEKNKFLQWEGKLFIPGIFTGRHTFQLIETKKNRIKLIQREDFEGILVPFFNYDSTIGGFKLMNNKLKERVESKL
jgi:hypothetical protein